MSFTLRSPAFNAGEHIPKKFTVDGENVSPPLEWSDPPEQTQSFALIVEDPDAPSGPFYHWGLYNIAATWRHIDQDLMDANDARNIMFSANDFGRPSYDGPKPPRGDAAHHYHFRLAALDTDRLDVPPQTPAKELWATIEPHILGQAELVGLYKR
jgi:Raf kinase inhibitor-like YbhB/YbcL family protein